MEFLEAQRDQYADEGKAPVAWERFLEIAPSVAAVDPSARPEALAACGVDACAWSRAEAYWLLTLALDLQQGRTDRVEAYGRAAATGFSSNRASAAVTRSGHVAAPGRVPETGILPETTADAASVVRTPALPFGRSASPDYAARLSAQAPALSSGARSPSPARPDATVLDKGPARSVALPFAASKPPGKLPELSVEQHARLSAELAIGGGAARDDVLRRYGIDSADSLTRLGLEWQSRMTADERLASEWRAAYARHRAALRQGQGSR